MARSAVLNGLRNQMASSAAEQQEFANNGNYPAGSPARTRADLQVGQEAAGESAEGTRQIANLGPVFDQMWGRAPNPANRPDLPKSAFSGGHVFHGLGDDASTAGDALSGLQSYFASRFPQQGIVGANGPLVK